MKKILLIPFFIFFIITSNSQVCGTPIPNNSLKKQVTPSTNKTSGASSPICVNVYFHIVRETNGSNAFVPNDVDDILNNLNEVFNPHGIFLNNSGTGFINNSGFVNIDDDNEANNLATINVIPDAINYYIVETLWNTPTGTVTGTALSIPSKALVIRNSRTLLETSPHELGHCLNLYHTFETAFGVEALNGSNCSSAGDLICDTPADSNQGPVGGFNPDLTNIMSYYPSRDHFTDD